MTCSSGESSTLTTIVIREISGCSVGPTASESMLKPRRLNSPAIRARTPGLFSTRTDRVCVGSSELVLVERRGAMSRAYLMSSLLVPAATIGHTIASRCTRKSTTTGTSLISIAFSIVASTSSGDSQASPTQP